MLMKHYRRFTEFSIEVHSPPYYSIRQDFKLKTVAVSRANLRYLQQRELSIEK